MYSNFEIHYRAAVSTQRIAYIDLDPQFLIPGIYEYQGTLPGASLQQYFHLLGGGSIHADQPLHFNFRQMDCLLLLYTSLGGGRFTSSLAGSRTMTDHDLLIWDCRVPFSLQSLVLPWNFRLFFFCGGNADLFRPFLHPQNCISRLPAYSPLLQSLQHLLSLPITYKDFGLLSMHQELTAILSAASQDVLSPEAADSTGLLPDYLTEMKDYFDHHYAESFSLQSFEEALKTSKYKLCRDFSSHFGLPPVQYLQRRRMERAKELLLTSGLQIQEISSSVGYENVTHFIHLFKKATGLTPGAFRQKGRALPLVSRSPVQ